MFKSFKTWLLEAAKKKKPVVVTFGRMNPITSGHAKLVDTIISIANKHNAEHRIYLSHSNDAAKNPLSYNDKIKFAKAYFPEVNFVKTDKVKIIYDVMKTLNAEGYKDVVLVVGDDRVEEFDRIKKYVGPDKDYKFDSFKIESAGKRDEKATDVTGMSASKMRQYVKDGDLAGFIAGTPKPSDKKLGKQMFDAVKKGMKI